MPFRIVRKNIVDMDVEIVVNSTSKDLEFIGGTERSVLEAGGNRLLNDRKSLGLINVAEVKHTKGHDLLSKYVIHTVGPSWNGDKAAYETLRQTYHNVLALAKTLDCESIAFPLISTGVNDFPRRKAIEIAQSEIKLFLEDSEMMVHLVVYDEKSFAYSQEFHPDIKDYLAHNYISKSSRLLTREFTKTRSLRSDSIHEMNINMNIKSLDNRLIDIDEGFSETLIKLIQDSGEKTSTIYRRANVTKQLFSKIKLDPFYHPSKQIAIAFAIALELNIDETGDLLERAGYSLSNSIKFDVIIEFCLQENIYDIMEVNNILFDMDQNLLGSTMN